MDLLDKEISDQFDKARRGEMRGKIVGGIRRFLAYGLKIVSVGGSFAIAAKFWPEKTHQLGWVVMGAVLVDAVFANYKRLIGEVKAGYAYKFLHERISSDHNAELAPFLNDDSPATRAKREDLKQKTRKALLEGNQAIAKGLAAVDIESLESIALDNKRAVQPGERNF